MQALEGIKIADFSWVGVGPWIAKYLADHGAETIRIESHTRPELLRTAPPYKDNIPGINRSGYFALFNSNKYSMSLNLNHPRGVEVARRLINWSDIVIESFGPGRMKKWGLGYEDIKKIKPDIIMLSTTQQGQTGPHADHPGFGTQLVSLAGFTYITGWPDRDPASIYGAYTDTIAPRFGAAALLAALDYRRRTGKGQYLDLSQYEAGIQFLTPLFLDYFVNGRIAERRGNRSPSAAPQGAYPCRGDERWCAIAVCTDKEWEAFCRAVGDPPWTQDLRFVTFLGRKENEDELDRLVAEWTINFSAEEAMTKLQAAGIAAGVVQNCQDIHGDLQLKHRYYFRELVHPEIGRHSYNSHAFKLSLTPCEIRMPAPCLGQHTEYVCTTILGMTDEEFVGLLTQGVLE